MTHTDRLLSEFWNKSRSGAWAGRGFRFQDSIAALLAIEFSYGTLLKRTIIPEGFDDVVIEAESEIDLIQVKSRSQSAGYFSNSEISAFVNKLNKLEQTINSSEGKVRRKWMFLERPPVSDKWISWSLFIDCYSEDSNVKSNESILVVVPDAKSIAMPLLESSLNIFPSVAEIIYHNILILCGYASNENASKTYRERYRISSHRIETLITKLLKSIDSSKLDEAIRLGLCNSVSFDDKLEDDNFYYGVNAEPGHIAAGLAVNRPSLISEVCEQLHKVKTVLIAGPSGSGKSALQWMCIKSLYENMRWFRVSKLIKANDVSSILNLIDGLQPSSNSPVGIVIDDVGKYDAELFGVIVRETQSRAGVILLGSVRNEDLSELGDLSSISVIQIDLDEELAGSIWEKINSELDTVWEHWREPYEMSSGLLLEYIHLLTQGKRLDDVIKGQIATRKKQSRFDELALIRVCSTAFSMGANISVKNLQQVLEISDEKISKSLERLLGEHLIRFSSSGTICGLHDLRSNALYVFSHDDLVYVREESVLLALGCLTTESIPYFIQSTISLDNANSYIEALIERLIRKPYANEWNSVLTGLGYASISNLKDHWVKTLQGINLEPAHWPVATVMACAGSKLDDIPEFLKVSKAVKEFGMLDSLDFRAALLSKTPELYKIDDINDIEDLISLYSGMGPLPSIGAINTEVLDFGGHITGDFAQICTLLDAARSISVEMAKNIVEKLGGSDDLLEKYFNHTPWISKPIVSIDSNGKKVVSSDMYFISDQLCEDIHETVVKICNQLSSIVPDADKVEAKAVDVEGKELRYGDYPIASKSIPRENLPAFVTQRWNQNLISLVVNQTSSSTETEYASLMRELIKRVDKYLNGFLEGWCRGKEKSFYQKNLKEIEQVAKESNKYSLQKSLLMNVSAKPINGGVDFNEPVSSLISSICGNLMPRLYNREPNNAALSGFTVSLLELSEKALEVSYWQLLKCDVNATISSIHQQLTWLRAVLGESAENKRFLDQIISISKKASRKNALRLCAVHAVESANRRFAEEKNLIYKAFRDQDIKVKIEELSAEIDRGSLWPTKELFIIIETDSIEEFLINIDEVMIVLSKYKDKTRTVYLMPVKNNIYVPQFSFSFLSEQLYPLISVDERIEPLIRGNILNGAFLKFFDEAQQALVILSGVIGVLDLSSLHQEESDAFDKAIEVCNEAEALFESNLENDSVEAFESALVLIQELREAVVQQSQGEINEFCPNLARSQCQVLKGELDEVMQHILIVRIELVEYEIAEMVV